MILGSMMKCYEKGNVARCNAAWYVMTIKERSCVDFRMWFEALHLSGFDDSGSMITK